MGCSLTFPSVELGPWVLALLRIGASLRFLKLLLGGVILLAKLTDCWILGLLECRWLALLDLFLHNCVLLMLSTPSGAPFGYSSSNKIQAHLRALTLSLSSWQTTTCSLNSSNGMTKVDVSQNTSQTSVLFNGTDKTFPLRNTSSPILL
jgi:hypothetical protein